MTTPRVRSAGLLLVTLSMTACPAPAPPPGAPSARSSPPSAPAAGAPPAPPAASGPVVTGPYARVLPAFTLADPRGKRHERAALLADGGVVVIVTAPTLACGDAQEAWNDALAAVAPSGGRWLLLEDLGQSSFPGTALGRMEEEFDPARPPLLLLDRDGAVRKLLGVGEDETVVLVYGGDGALLHADATGPSEAGARRAWAALAAAGLTGERGRILRA